MNDIAIDHLSDELNGEDTPPVDNFAPREHRIVSLFSGCGGMDMGFIGGFKFGRRKYDRIPNRVIYANDIDRWACEAYRRHFGHKIDEGDIREILENDKLPKSADILIGGFPCQDFSRAGKRKGFASERGVLYRSMVEAARRLKPKVFIAENVKGITSIPGVMDKIIADFREAGFVDVQFHEVQCAKYGIPQNRERVFIIGWKYRKHANKFAFPSQEDKPMTARDAIDDLKNVDWGEKDGHTWALAKRREDLQGNETTPVDGPAYTIRAEHHMNIQFHYAVDRRISVREAARLQTFPDEFVFEDISKNQGYRMVGNAVPPVMAWKIAKAVEEALRS